MAGSSDKVGWFDYIVVAVILLCYLFIGIYYTYKRKGKGTNNQELFKASKKLGAIPMAASMVVTTLNAVTILGYPAEIYANGSQMYLLTPIGTITAFAGIYFFAKVLYPLQLTSAYEYFEGRFDSAAVRVVSSFIYVFQLLLGMGVVLYAPAIALEAIIGVPFWISIIAMAFCSTIYTSIGGLTVVVWTDVIQFVIIMIGVTTIIVKAIYEAGGLSKAFQVANEGGRLEIVDWSVDPFMRHNTLNIVLGAGFTGFFGAVSPPTVQRYCSLPTFRSAVKSFIWSFVMQAVIITLVVFTGILLYAIYADCDPITDGKVSFSDQILPYFVVENLSFIPGMVGLFITVIFSAVLSTISSVLNTLAALTWQDFLSKIKYFKEMNDSEQALTYKVQSILFGIIIAVLGYYANKLGSVFQATIIVAGTAIGIHGSVFFMGVFMPFVNGIGAAVGMIVGVAIMGFVAVESFYLQQKYSFVTSLPYSVEGCEAETFFGEILAATEASDITSTTGFPRVEDLDWPDKLYTVSYVLYSLLGGIVTIVVSIIVSLATKGWQNRKKVNPKFLHPLVRPITDQVSVANLTQVKTSIAYTDDSCAELSSAEIDDGKKSTKYGLEAKL